jgi:hypothetical protein
MPARSVLAASAGNVIYLAGLGGRPRPQAAFEQERRDAVKLLQEIIHPDSIVYIVPRIDDPDSDWLIVDFFLIDGPHVVCVTTEVAHATNQYDPEREVGLKLRRPRGTNPLRTLIDGTLSRVLFSEPDRVRHQLIR